MIHVYDVLAGHVTTFILRRVRLNALAKVEGNDAMFASAFIKLLDSIKIGIMADDEVRRTILISGEDYISNLRRLRCELPVKKFREIFEQMFSVCIPSENLSQISENEWYDMMFRVYSKVYDDVVAEIHNQPGLVNYMGKNMEAGIEEHIKNIARNSINARVTELQSKFSNDTEMVLSTSMWAKMQEMLDTTTQAVRDLKQKLDREQKKSDEYRHKIKQLKRQVEEMAERMVPAPSPSKLPRRRPVKKPTPTPSSSESGSSSDSGTESGSGSESDSGSGSDSGSHSGSDSSTSSKGSKIESVLDSDDEVSLTKLFANSEDPYEGD